MICIRGAITVTENNKGEILQAASRMLHAMIARNAIEIEDIIEIQFTMTQDLDAVYPAVAARDMGITEAGLVCMQELFVKDSLPQCIRCAMLCDSNKKQRDVFHVYLEEATKLRPDLSK